MVRTATLILFFARREDPCAKSNDLVDQGFSSGESGQSSYIPEPFASPTTPKLSGEMHKGDRTSKSPAALSVMEARGVEPRSETGFTTASTCVAHRLRSPSAGQWAAHVWTSLPNFRVRPEDAASRYPEFPILVETPQESFLTSRCSNYESYAARAKLLLAVKKNPRVLPGPENTWARGHSFTNPVEASRPRTRNVAGRAPQVNQFEALQ
jgi:hypothetical protein